MTTSPAIERPDDWKKKEAREVHRFLEELRKPDVLDDLIMSTVSFIVEKLSRPGDATEVSGELAMLIELLQNQTVSNRLTIEP